MRDANENPGSAACPFGQDGRRFDLFAEPGYAHQHSMLKKARQGAPVFYHEELKLWIVSRYDDVVRVLKDDKQFSSSVRHVILANLVDEAREILATTDTFSAPNMGFDHIPDHTRLRKPFVGHFSPKGVAERAPEIHKIANFVLDELSISSGPIDLVGDVSRPLATRVIMDLIGIPVEEYDIFKRYGDVVHAFFFGMIPPEMQIQYADDLRKGEEYLTRFINFRRRNLADDLTSYLLRETANSRVKYSDAEIVGFLSFDIIGAGIRSTSFALPNLCRELLQERRYWDALVQEPSLFDKLFAEALRRSALGIGLYRQTIAEVEVAGVNIPADSIVWVLTASADHDETYFLDPEIFDPTRINLKKSVAFGHGLHFCLGQNLARLVTRIGIEQLMGRHPDLQLVPNQKIEYEPSFNVMVMSKLLVNL